MPLALHWFLPTTVDSRTVIPFGDDGHGRAPTIDYLAQVARAADQLGYTGVLTPTGTWCEDAWLVTAALLRETKRLKFLVAFRPGALTPTLAAQKAATYQRISDGRLLLNIVTGGEPSEQRRFGDWLDHDERYDRTDEFLSVLRGSWADEPFDFEGRHYHVEGATTSKPVTPPELYFGGASPAAEQVAAKHVDVYLAWGEPPSMVAPRLARMRELAAEHGRTLRFGIRLHVITRDRAQGRMGGDGALPRPARPEGRRGIAGGVREERVRRSAADGLAARRHARVARRGAEPVGRLWPRPWRRRHDAGRQPRGGRRPHRGVPRSGVRRVHPLRPSSPRGGLLVRRGRQADTPPPGSARRTPGGSGRSARARRSTSPRWRRADGSSRPSRCHGASIRSPLDRAACSARHGCSGCGSCSSRHGAISEKSMAPPSEVWSAFVDLVSSRRAAAPPLGVVAAGRHRARRSVSPRASCSPSSPGCSASARTSSTGRCRSSARCRCSPCCRSRSCGSASASSRRSP